jgi:hypothetical protein
MNIDTVTQDIQHWIETFVEVKHPALGGWPPCPYARSARLNRSYQIFLGTDPYFDLKNQADQGLPDQKEVVILVYDPARWSADQFAHSIEQANQEHLLQQDLIALPDHPLDPEVVNGVIMNQGTWALALVQSLSDLNAKAQAIGRQGFYYNWPESYLTELFQHRTDPRL